MPEYAVTAIGQDRPGIVAAISGALLELGGNIEDSQMSILGGHFAVMLIAGVPEDVSRESLSEALSGVRERLGLEAITFNDVGAGGAVPARASHVLSVYGADHPGIVHSVSVVLADQGVNITDLETRVGGGENPLYAMILEVALGDADPGTVEAALHEVAEQEQVEVSLRAIEAESL